MLIALALLSFIACCALLGALAWTDHKLYILPNTYNLALFICFVIFHFSTRWAYVSPIDAVIGALVGGGFLLSIRYVANKIMKADTVGLGDVKLLIACGFGLGMPDILLIISIGSFFGIGHGFILQQVARKKTGVTPSIMTINVPAGVGLCLAAFLMLFYKYQDFLTGLIT